MDSIRENLNLEDLVDILRLELNADMDDGSCILLVEGQDDVTFIKRVFGKDICCYESFSGKEGLNELIEHSDIQNERIIAIRDKDYSNPEQYPERMFCYDKSCLETMMLSSEEVRRGLWGTYYKGNKEQEIFVVNAMRELAPLSVLREANDVGGGRIDFKKIGLGNYIDGDNENVDFDGIWSRVESLATIPITKDECISESASWIEQELYDKTNGHDLCKFLGKVCKNGKGDLGEDKLRDVLICSYRMSDFQMTNLFQLLKNYQTTYQLRLL